jgi:hypothetical protein
MKALFALSNFINLFIGGVPTRYAPAVLLLLLYCFMKLRSTVWRMPPLR